MFDFDANQFKQFLSEFLQIIIASVRKQSEVERNRSAEILLNVQPLLASCLLHGFENVTE